MSSFYCEYCGAVCSDSEKGYTTGCEHYPPDVVEFEEAKNSKVTRSVEDIWWRIRFRNGRSKKFKIPVK